MRHPFDGIIVPESQPAAPPTRRSVLGKLLAAAAGLGGLLLGSKAQARPIATTLAIGEEGGPRPTTLALFEEGATTLALGEEGSVTTQALYEEGATTLAKGEEGGVTTLALGEEGQANPINPPITTHAIGEEGNGPPKKTK